MRTALHQIKNRKRGAYGYDGLGRLSLREVFENGASRRLHLIHDRHDRVIAELDSQGRSLREYLWLDDLPVAVLDGTQDADHPDLLFVHADHLRRPLLMSDAARTPVWRAAYAPFGAVQRITGTRALDLRFPGQWFQLETGLAYNWHRHYDATLGRYTQADPLGIGDGPGVYAYAHGDPLQKVDPEGLQSFSPDQQALIGLAKEAQRMGISNNQAVILLGWGRELCIRPLHDHRNTNHWIGGPHIRIGPVNHIPVK